MPLPDPHSYADSDQPSVEHLDLRLRVRFDTEGKRTGTPVELRLAPAARNLGFFPAAPRERVYRLTLETTTGLVPARVDRNSSDPRDLGVFLGVAALAVDVVELLRFAVVRLQVLICQRPGGRDAAVPL